MLAYYMVYSDLNPTEALQLKYSAAAWRVWGNQKRISRVNKSYVSWFKEEQSAICWGEQNAPQETKLRCQYKDA